MNVVTSAVKALIKNGDKFLVIKHDLGKNGLWDLPGGRMEYGETPYETLKREVKEEVSLDIEIGELLGIWWFFREKNDVQVICNTFLCQVPNKNIDLSGNPADENILEYRWVTKEEFLTDDYPVGNESFKKFISTL